MSKDRQQRNTHVPTAGSRTATMELREQQASVAPEQPQTTIQGRVAEYVPAAPDRELAQLREQAEQLGGNVGLAGFDSEEEFARHGGPPAQTNPPANIPRAVHHLRRAVHALPRDPVGEVLVRVGASVIEKIGMPLMRRWKDKDGDEQVEEVKEQHEAERRQLAVIAAALDLDVHAGGAAKDVRAAIEALS